MKRTQMIFALMIFLALMGNLSIARGGDGRATH